MDWDAIGAAAVVATLFYLALELLGWFPRTLRIRLTKLQGKRHIANATQPWLWFDNQEKYLGVW